MTHQKLLTKSKYLVGLQCYKYLWIIFNKPGLIPEADAGLQFRFDQGHLVGELAKRLFPGGIDIPTEPFDENLKQSRELLKKRKPLFEAAFSNDGIYARADILNPVGKNEWDIIEVKSGTIVEDIYLQDLSFQKHCYEKAGLKIRKCFLIHINNKYVKNGEIDPKRIFAKEDVTGQVKAIQGIKDRIELMRGTIYLEKCPEAKIGKICSKPYGCPLMDYCWKFLPKNSVFDLYGRNKAEELLEMGILAIKDIPEGFKLSDKQEIQRKCSKTGKSIINKEHIRHFLKTLRYPLYFMDFETFQTAIPLYDGLKPYQQVPFQFSLHAIRKEGAKPEHFYFLASGKEDPRKQFAAELNKVIGNKGSVVTYNSSFESARLKELAEAYPKDRKWINNVLNRIVDLLIPFRSFYYYNPKQQGSASIKKVMPALIGKGYGDLEIAEGGSASLAFLDIIFGKIPKKDRQRLRKDLERYCERDTEGMIWIVKELERLTE
jgi:hypothetical protein